MRNSEAQLSESDRQAFLCYWQGQVSAGSTAFTTNLRGERCSSLGFPPLYKYKGQVSEVGFATFALMTNDTTAATN